MDRQQRRDDDDHLREHAGELSPSRPRACREGGGDDERDGEELAHPFAQERLRARRRPPVGALEREACDRGSHRLPSTQERGGFDGEPRHRTQCGTDGERPLAGQVRDQDRIAADRRIEDARPDQVLVAL